MADSKPCFDEMFGFDESPRQPYSDYQGWVSSEDPAQLRKKAAAGKGGHRGRRLAGGEPRAEGRKT